MTRVGVRELRLSLSSLVRRASAGERVLVTLAGRPVAQLGPIEAAGPVTIEDLAARGLIRAARRDDRPLADGTIALWSGARLDQLVREVRGR